MGIFDRLFGSSETPSETSETPPTTPLGDPYRDAAYVEVPHAKPLEPLPPIAAIWDSWTRVLALERGGELPLGAIVYDGEDDVRGVRRVRFHPNGATIDWETTITRDQLSNHLVVCAAERVIIPRATGIFARHVVTGEVCWELAHPAALIRQPVQFPDGDLLFVFGDRSWMRLAPRDGAFREEGTVRTEADAEELMKRCRPIVSELEDSVVYGGREVSISDGLRVTDGRRSDGDRPGPTVGDYPIDEWEANNVIALFDDKLVVWLEKSWNDVKSGAIGVLEPTSLEPLRLIELGAAELREAYRLDDFLVVNVNKSAQFFTTMIVDIANERVIASFIEGHIESSLYDHDGESIWRGRL